MSRQQPPQKNTQNNRGLFSPLLQLSEKIYRKSSKALMLPFKLLALLLTEIQKTAKKIIKTISRRLLLPRKQPQFSRSGFLLPTVAVLLIVLSLVVASLLKQSQNRTADVIADRREQVTANAATPAIDRAKAKLQYMFTSDPRWPRYLPPDPFIVSMLTNDGVQVYKFDIDTTNTGIDSPYLLPDETALDLDKDGKDDPAWSFKMDTNGDGKVETVAYSLLVKTSETTTNPIITRGSSDTIKAKYLVARNGPVNMNYIGSGACDSLTADQTGDKGGWDGINAATFKRAFQVTAVVVDQAGGTNRSVTTLEMQQDRQAEKGNKWGAWFRYDLEIFNGPVFRWNGAMHTEGNLIIGPDNNLFRAYLISDPASCLYNARENSEITVAGNRDESIPPFMGQIIRGSMKLNNSSQQDSGRIKFDLYTEPDPATNNIQMGDDSSTNNTNQFVLNNATDSVTTNDTNASAALASMALDPVFLVTNTDNSLSANNNISRDWTNDNTKNNKNVRAAGWKSSEAVNKGRVYNKTEVAPYVDDTYRADNRYGPKPQYTPVIRLNGNNTGTQILSTHNYASDLLNNPSTIKSQVVAGTLQADKRGYDGYWEARAYVEGLRIIVGQRLELGNAFGWVPTTTAANSDPLNPPSQGWCVATSPLRCHELRQWRTLRDNLAAVQTTAIYHNDRTADPGNDPIPGYFPLACLATTTHPGTRTTVALSTIFNNININGTDVINTDFFTGRGTNGWEFNPPASNEGAFATALSTSTSPLRVALKNLAFFAGDPFGAFPARQDRDGSIAVGTTQVTHPYAPLRMWGDFSNLRRTVALLEGGTNYDNLSIADQTNLHTAACTLGVLAYNIDNLQTYDPTNTTNQTALNSLYTTYLRTGATANTALAAADPANPDAYISKLPLTSNSTGLLSRPQDFARLVHLREQVNQDRRMGFATFDTTITNQTQYPIQFTTGYNYSVRVNNGASPGVQTISFSNANNGGTYRTDNNNLTAGAVTTIKNLQLGFDFSPTTGNNFFGFGPPTNASTEERFISLALSLGPEGPKYPALYYLFPKYDHGHLGGTFNNLTPANTSDDTNHTQPTTEPYIDNTVGYVNNTAVNGSYTYKVINDINANGFEDPSEMSATGGGIRSIEIMPRTVANWVLPDTGTTNGRVNVIRDKTGGSTIGTAAAIAGTNLTEPPPNRAVAFLDDGIFNGREMMSVRVLDVDIDLLRTNTAPFTNENWLPYSAIVYAFREDAVREDAIARPSRSVAWTSCNNADLIDNSGCVMNATGTNEFDPPVNSANGISAKPVDFYADPDRRPHGFRLRNGRRLDRGNTPPLDFKFKGMSFISDSPVYIMADGGFFNQHTSDGTNSIEEFTNTLNDDWGDFYARHTSGTNSGLNQNFAGINDRWRSAEIVADAVSVLSQNFVDGSIAEGITRADNGSTSSYRTLNAPGTGADATQAARNWVREDGTFTNSVSYPSPIRISRNGYPLYNSGTNSAPNNVEHGRETANTNNTGNGVYMNFSDNKTLIGAANPVTVNAVIISGIVPSRGGQAYGGFHNFPRFIEQWDTRVLNMIGAFIQLNFSTSATGPFDQDSWEPGNAPDAGSELIRYYGAPVRRWGYDVGLQYTPAGPVANRFITAGNARSEYYRKLPVDDPYVCLLRKATVSGTPIDSSTGDCPT